MLQGYPCAPSCVRSFIPTTPTNCCNNSFRPIDACVPAHLLIGDLSFVMQ